MKQFFGCFYAPRDLKYPADGFDAPINYMGRHMLAGRQIAADGGAMAMAVGSPYFFVSCSSIGFLSLCVQAV